MVKDVWVIECAPKFYRAIDHRFFFGDNLSAPRHTAKMVPCVAVVALDTDGSAFSDNVAFFGQNLRKSLPIICIECTLFQMLDFIIESLERCSITIPCNPGNRSPCTTIHGFDDPYFVFFEPMKCHISSNSISLISAKIVGSRVFSMASITQR